MDIFNELMATLPNGRVASVSIGLHWTAVVMDVHGELRCGLASTLQDDHQHGVPTVPQAGNLENLTGLGLAALILAEQPTLVSVGMAAVNALLHQQPGSWVDLNAEDVIAVHGAGQHAGLLLTGLRKLLVNVGGDNYVPSIYTRLVEAKPKLAEWPRALWRSAEAHDLRG